MEYKVAFGTGRTFVEAINALQADVNQLIDVGWRPFGGLAIGEGSGPEPFLLAQAMVLNEPR